MSATGPSSRPCYLGVQVGPAVPRVATGTYPAALGVSASQARDREVIGGILDRDPAADDMSGIVEPILGAPGHQPETRGIVSAELELLSIYMIMRHDVWRLRSVAAWQHIVNRCHAPQV